MCNTSLKARKPGMYGTCIRTTSNSSWTISKVLASRTTTAAHAIEGSFFRKLMSTPPIYFSLALASLWSEFELTEGKDHSKSSSRTSLLLSTSCVLHHQTTSRGHESTPRSCPPKMNRYKLSLKKERHIQTSPTLFSVAPDQSHLLLYPSPFWFLLALWSGALGGRWKPRNFKLDRAIR